MKSDDRPVAVSNLVELLPRKDEKDSDHGGRSLLRSNSPNRYEKPGVLYRNQALEATQLFGSGPRTTLRFRE